MRLSWINHRDIIEYEIRQLKLEGLDVSRIQEDWNKLNYKELSSSETTDFMMRMYDEVEAENDNYISKKATADREFIDKLVDQENVNYKNEVAKEKLFDKILGGWLGRSSGCLLGKPIEKYSRQVIREILESSGQYPLKYYMSGQNVPIEVKEKYPWNKHSGKESLLENLVCMTEDDDLNYPMINLKIAEQYQGIITTENIAKMWLENIPVMSTFTAERVAYKNLLINNDVDQSGIKQNPYREWIGALIRADLWGWISAGDPKLAAIRAYNDARFTHVSNGVWGEVFISVLISLSFIIDDEMELINRSLKFIPEDCEVSKSINFVVEVVGKENNWEKVVNLLYEKLNHLHWVHVLNNISLIVAILLYWGKDFENAICSTVMAGWDTDSNGATVGSIIGTLIGASSLPVKWIKPLNNNIRSSMKGFDHSKIDDLAKRTAIITKINLER